MKPTEGIVVLPDIEDNVEEVKLSVEKKEGIIRGIFRQCKQSKRYKNRENGSIG